MLKSLEDYLSSLSFDAPNPEPGKRSLNSLERAFVEKYLGEDALERMPVLEPEPIPLPQLLPRQKEPKRQTAFEPRIIIATPAPKLEIKIEGTDADQKVKTIEATPQLVVVKEDSAVPSTVKTAAAQKVKAEDVAASEIDQAVANAAVAPVVGEDAAKVVEETGEQAKVKSSAKTETHVVEKTAATPGVSSPGQNVETKAAEKVIVEETALATSKAAIKADANEIHNAAAVLKAEAAAPAELSLRERMRQAAEIQVVSFFVSDQLFLLPVAGIQEVLRHMELVRVPQAPEFVAGAINLRGTVMPLVHLSALLTNAPAWKYDEQSFIIVTDSSTLQMGLIIDKVSSMHMIPQKKIIWNAESKLGEAAEFLSAIVDLDDKVCGMIAPELIAQKLFSEF